MAFTSEEIVRVTTKAFEDFLKTLLKAEDYQEFEMYKNNVFPTWSHLWEKLRPWLQENPFRTMPDTILSLFDQFQESQSFRSYLQNSLSLHDSFWNQVYENLLVAKNRLTC